MDNKWTKWKNNAKFVQINNTYFGHILPNYTRSYTRFFYKQLEIFVRYWSCLTSVPIFSAIPPTLPPQIGLKWPSQAAESFDIVFLAADKYFSIFVKKIVKISVLVAYRGVAYKKTSYISGFIGLDYVTQNTKVRKQ